MILKGTEYCAYSGDVNQDEVIDVTDLIMIFNASMNPVIGYLQSDVP